MKSKPGIIRSNIFTLVSMQNRAARIITRADYSISSSDVRSSLKWSNLEERKKGTY